MSDPNQEIWLTYEGILSEVEDEYKAKFDATETVKQWAVARRMYQKGREHAIQELIEKVGPKASVYSYNRYGGGELEWDYNVADWLKSQMEGE